MAPGLIAPSTAAGEIDGFHPRIVPSSVEKMKTAAADAVPFVTSKPVPMFATAPVGAFFTSTVRGTLLPFARYSVETFVPLSATHQGDVGVDVSPHALTRFMSWSAATSAWSETR